LDDGEKLDKTIRKAEEFTAKGCPRCGYTPFHKRCMSCGYEKVAKKLEEAEPGNMQEIFIGHGANKKKLANSAEDLWNQVCTYARLHSKPENQKGRAWHLFKDITGQESKWAFHSSEFVDITKNTYNKIQNLNMRWRKGRGG
jgi:predicted nucleic-acid-binding Zn-ribbon protein